MKKLQTPKAHPRSFLKVGVLHLLHGKFWAGIFMILSGIKLYILDFSFSKAIHVPCVKLESKMSHFPWPGGQGLGLAHLYSLVHTNTSCSCCKVLLWLMTNQALVDPDDQLRMIHLLFQAKQNPSLALRYLNPQEGLTSGSQIKVMQILITRIWSGSTIGNTNSSLGKDQLTPSTGDSSLVDTAEL